MTKTKEVVNEQVKFEEENALDCMQESTQGAAPALLSTQVKESYELFVDQEGKYRRKAVYSAWSSVHPETKEQKIALLNLLNSGDEAAALSDYIGAQIQVADVLFNPYDRINEETGEQEFGVLSYIITPEGTPYVTSSKSVYFTLKRMFQVFGEPHYSGEEVVTVQPVKKKGKEFQFIDLKIIG